MMRSMFSGVSGIRNHQTRMDVIGNNIANVNTVGYKKSRVTFQDMLSQTIRGAAPPQGGKGGINPQQVGLGMNVNSIDSVHTQGSSETTGKVTDMMIDGDGFFVVGEGESTYYTRAGNFDFDSVGNLVTPAGQFVKGWMADLVGNIDTTQLITSVKIPKGQSIQPKETSTATLLGNLDANAATGTAVPAAMTIYDSLGQGFTVNVIYTKSAAPRTWNLSVSNPGGWTAAPVLGGGPLVFDVNGMYSSGAPVTITGIPPNADPLSIVVNVQSMTQFDSESSVKMNEQDGYSSGVLNGYSVDKTGIVTGRFSNGLTKQLAQVVVANFNNPVGLIKVGENLFISSTNSGQVQIGTAGTGGRGGIAPGKLEMSNVDLSQEFTDMIVTQRGFQANSRIISVSDEMLQELVNLKR